MGCVVNVGNDGGGKHRQGRLTCFESEAAAKIAVLEPLTRSGSRWRHRTPTRRKPWASVGAAPAQLWPVRCLGSGTHPFEGVCRSSARVPPGYSW